MVKIKVLKYHEFVSSLCFDRNCIINVGNTNNFRKNQIGYLYHFDHFYKFVFPILNMSAVKKEVVWICGGDGLVGNYLVHSSDDYQWVILTRTLSKTKQDKNKYFYWQPKESYIEKDIPMPDHIINLAGAGIADQRWTSKRKKMLVESRVQSANTIKAYIKRCNFRPKTYISASAIGYYGDRQDEVLNENSKDGDGFLSECCIEWENAAHSAGALCERTVILRIGVVLSQNGGALPKLLMTRGFGLFIYFGSGNQYFSWIHIDDLVRVIFTAIQDEQMFGVYNAVSPQPITAKEMMRDIKQVNQWFGILMPFPSFLIKIVVGEMSHIFLDSTRVLPKRLEKDANFKFQYDRVGNAVADLYKV